MEILLQPVVIISNVAIKAEVIQAPQLFVRLDVRHYHVSVFLVSPLLPQQLVQVDRLQGTDFSCILNQLVQVSFLGLFTLFPLFSQVNTGILSSLDTFLALLIVPDSCHRAYLIEDFCS